MGDGITRKVFLTFPQRLSGVPILYELVQKFPVKTNILASSISEEIALISLQLEGGEQAVAEAIEHLQGLGVSVEVLS